MLPEERLDDPAARVVRARPAPCSGHDLGGSLSSQGEHGPAVGDLGGPTQRPFPLVDGPPDELRHTGVALEARHIGGLEGHRPRSLVQAGRCRQLDTGFAERRQHLVYVTQKGRVGPHNEHPLHLEREAVRVQQIGGTVERHGGLAGPRPTLDDQSARQGSPDDLVLLGLDRGDDVAHPPGVSSRESRQQHARPSQAERFGPPRPIALCEELVLEVHDASAVGQEMAAPAQAHGARTRRTVERLGDRRPPVHHERLVLGVRDRQPADVKGLVPPPSSWADDSRSAGRVSDGPPSAEPVSDGPPSAEPVSAEPTSAGPASAGPASAGPSSPGSLWARSMRPKISASRPSCSFSRRFSPLRTRMSRSVNDWNVPPLSRNASLS